MHRLEMPTKPSGPALSIALLFVTLVKMFYFLSAMHRRFQRDLQGAVQYIQAPGPLKEAVKRLYRTHCTQTLDTTSIEQEVLSEYDRQREFLEKTVDTLKHKLHQEVKSHKAENSNAMLVRTDT